MRTIKPIVGVILILISYTVLNGAVVNFLSNALAIFRQDNRVDLLNVAYKEELDRLSKTISDYELAQNNLKIYDGENVVLAKTAIRNVYDIYDYVVVHTPSKVSIGNAVLNEDGLVGIVREVTKTTAKVSLLTGGEKVSVKVGDSYGILGEYDRENDEFLIHNIDNYKSIDAGSEVVTSGFQDIASGIAVGTVSSVETKGVEKIVRMKPYVDFDDLNYLVILSK